MEAVLTKRNIPKSPNVQRSPSKVLYVRKLACSVTTYLLEHILSQYGEVIRTVILRPKNEALIEMNSLEDAKRVYSLGQEQKLVIHKSALKVSYSDHKNIELLLNHNPENKILLFTICTIPGSYLHIEELAKNIEKYGELKRIRLFKHCSIHHALVQMNTLEDAKNVKEQMSKISIQVKNEIFRFDIQYSKLQELVIYQNNSTCLNYDLISNDSIPTTNMCYNSPYMCSPCYYPKYDPSMPSLMAPFADPQYAMLDPLDLESYDKENNNININSNMAGEIISETLSESSYNTINSLKGSLFNDIPDSMNNSMNNSVNEISSTNENFNIKTKSLNDTDSTCSLPETISTTTNNTITMNKTQTMSNLPESYSEFLSPRKPFYSSDSFNTYTKNNISKKSMFNSYQEPVNFELSNTMDMNNSIYNTENNDYTKDYYYDNNYYLNNYYLNNNNNPYSHQYNSNSMYNNTSYQNDFSFLDSKPMVIYKLEGWSEDIPNYSVQTYFQHLKIFETFEIFKDSNYCFIQCIPKYSVEEINNLFNKWPLHDSYILYHVYHISVVKLSFTVSITLSISLLLLSLSYVYLEFFLCIIYLFFLLW
ncbi:hypothetical protein WA158_007851 [Blastocystis sp. Blastoise]